jgi:hypothetical protein
LGESWDEKAGGKRKVGEMFLVKQKRAKENP